MQKEDNNIHINKPVIFLGINYKEVFYVLGIFLGTLILMLIIFFLLNIMLTSLFLVGTCASLGLYVFLRKTNKVNHPTFLYSWISFNLRQPKAIEFKNGKPRVKSIYR